MLLLRPSGQGLRLPFPQDGCLSSLGCEMAGGFFGHASTLVNELWHAAPGACLTEDTSFRSERKPAN